MYFTLASRTGLPSISRFFERQIKASSPANLIELLDMPIRPSLSTLSDSVVRVFLSRIHREVPLPSSESKNHDRGVFRAGIPTPASRRYESVLRPIVNVVIHLQKSFIQRRLTGHALFAPLGSLFHVPINPVNSLSGSSSASPRDDGERSRTLLSCQRSPFFNQTDMHRFDWLPHSGCLIVTIPSSRATSGTGEFH